MAEGTSPQRRVRVSGGSQHAVLAELLNAYTGDRRQGSLASQRFTLTCLDPSTGASLGEVGLEVTQVSRVGLDGVVHEFKARAYFTSDMLTDRPVEGNFNFQTQAGTID